MDGDHPVCPLYLLRICRYQGRLSSLKDVLILRTEPNRSDYGVCTRDTQQYGESIRPIHDATKTAVTRCVLRLFVICSIVSALRYSVCPLGPNSSIVKLLYGLSCLFDSVRHVGF